MPKNWSVSWEKDFAEISTEYAKVPFMLSAKLSSAVVPELLKNLHKETTFEKTDGSVESIIRQRFKTLKLMTMDSIPDFKGDADPLSFSGTFEDIALEMIEDEREHPCKKNPFSTLF